MGSNWKKKHKSKALITTLKIVGTILAVVAIPSILIITARGDSDSDCKKIGFDGADLTGDSCVINNKYAYENIFIITGNTANSPKPEITDAIKKRLVNSMAQDNGVKITILSASTAIDRISSQTYDSETSSGRLDDTLAQISDNLNQIAEDIITPPTTDGATYLEAILKANKSLPKDEANLIIVIGSGLSDGGVLNFADNNLINTDLTDIKNDLNTKDMLSFNAKFEDILWSGLGDTVAPQETLYSFDIAKVEEIYELIFSDIILDQQFNTESVETTHTVKTASGSTVVINDELGFIPGTSNFKDYNKVIENISDFVTSAKAHPSNTIYITGYVAKGSCESSRDMNLAQARANATKTLLESLGVQNEIVTSTSSDGIVDECASGTYNEELAKQNRIVTINQRRA